MLLRKNLLIDSANYQKKCQYFVSFPCSCLLQKNRNTCYFFLEKIVDTLILQLQLILKFGVKGVLKELIEDRQNI
jgi:hypothetical protein